MNENQAMRKMKDRANSLRDFRHDHNPHVSMSPIEKEAMRVNAATLKEERDIGAPDPHPNTVVY